jgi:hypothetical protein
MERWQRSQIHRPLRLLARRLLTPDPLRRLCWQGVTQAGTVCRRLAQAGWQRPRPTLWQTPLRVPDTGAHIRQGLSHMFDASTTLEGVAFAPQSAITWLPTGALRSRCAIRTAIRLALLAYAESQPRSSPEVARALLSHCETVNIAATSRASDVLRDVVDRHGSCNAVGCQHACRLPGQGAREEGDAVQGEEIQG